MTALSIPIEETDAYTLRRRLCEMEKRLARIEKTLMQLRESTQASTSVLNEFKASCNNRVDKISESG